MKHFIACVGILFSVGCQSAPADLRHARVNDLTAAQHAELARLVATAVGQDEVRIGTDAFTASHILVLEPRQAHTPQGTVATGWTTDKPHTFHLLSDGSECLLEHVNSGQRYPLSFSCTAI